MAGFALLLTSCRKDEPASVSGNIDLSDVIIAESINVPGDLAFKASLKDKTTDLSTMEISAALEDGTVLAEKSIRTPGHEFTAEDVLAIPFAANMAEGSDILVTFTGINIKGESVNQTKKVSIVRPALPDKLYMKTGTDVLELKLTETANVYKSPEGDYESIVSAVFSTAEDFSTAEFIWGTSEKENNAQICAFSDASGVAVSFPSTLVHQYIFNALTFEVTVAGDQLNVSVNGSALSPQSGVLYSSISFTKGDEVKITGISDLEGAYNRDFFGKEGDKLTFLRESGTYDVFYSPKYNYFWIAKMDAVAPECLWIIGHGFTCATTWHKDYGYGGWANDNILTMGYAPRIDENKYQCSMYLNTAHEWDSFEFEVYSNLDSGKENGFAGKSLSGFTKGVALSGAADGKPGLTSDSGFQAGYYVITFDNATGDINLDRITPWEDAGKSGIVIGGVELDVDKDGGFDYADIEFTTGDEVAFSGIEADELNRDFFNVADGKVTFAGVSGTYQVKYFPAYNYTWVCGKGMSFPDCIYILGSGKWAAPVFSETALSEDVAYNRDAPYFVVAPKTADGTYKATMSMSPVNIDERVLLEFYSDLSWGQEGTMPVALGGSAASKFTLDTEKGWLCGVDEENNPFVPGNYQMIITASSHGLSLDITKID